MRNDPREVLPENAAARAALDAVRAGMSDDTRPTTIEVGSDPTATLISDLREKLHVLCLERDSTDGCYGLMKDASRWLREFKTGQRTVAERVIPVCSTCGDRGLTVDEHGNDDGVCACQVIPVRSDAWPDEAAISAGGVAHGYWASRPMAPAATVEGHDRSAALEVLAAAVKASPPDAALIAELREWVEEADAECEGEGREPHNLVWVAGARAVLRGLSAFLDEHEKGTEAQ